MDLEILTEDVKEFCRKATLKTEARQPSLAENTKMLDDLLANYDPFYQLVILAIIARRGMTYTDWAASEAFIDYYFDNTKLKRRGYKNANDFVIYWLADHDRRDAIGDGKRTHERWNEVIHAVLSQIKQKDDYELNRKWHWPLPLES